MRTNFDFDKGRLVKSKEHVGAAQIRRARITPQEVRPPLRNIVPSAHSPVPAGSLRVSKNFLAFFHGTRTAQYVAFPEIPKRFLRPYSPSGFGWVDSLLDGLFGVFTAALVLLIAVGLLLKW